MRLRSASSWPRKRATLTSAGTLLPSTRDRGVPRRLS
jgi:hypothetical protein